MKQLSKFTQLNFIHEVLAPRYHDKTVIIATHRIKRSKLDIKLKFDGVSETSEYAGYWFLPRNKALKYKDFNNNGLLCKAIPWAAFQKLELIEREDF